MTTTPASRGQIIALGADRGNGKPAQQTVGFVERAAGLLDLSANGRQLLCVGVDSREVGLIVTAAGHERAAARPDDGTALGDEKSYRRLGGVDGDVVLGRDLPVGGQLLAGAVPAAVDLRPEQVCDTSTREASPSVCGFDIGHDSQVTRRLETELDAMTERIYRRSQINRIKTVDAHEGDEMKGYIDPAALTECVAPLDEEDRRAVVQHWEQVIREEWVPPVRRMPRALSMAELDERRERREARRAIARIAAAGRLARVHVLPVVATASVASSFTSSVLAGVAA